MALTFVKVARGVAGNERFNIFDFTADNAYAAGGYTLAASDIATLTNPESRGAKSAVSDIISFDSETNVGGYNLSLDRANSKLKFFLGATEATTTISSATVRARVSYGFANSK